jgi:hypothetical protein
MASPTPTFLAGLLRPLLALAWIACPLAVAHAEDADEGGDSARAKRPIEELFQTHVVYPQEKGELELALTSVWQRRPGGNVWTLPVSLEYGITDAWQVEAEWNSLVQRYPSGHSVVRGVGDVEVGTQYTFPNIGGSTFHIAPRFSVLIPTGSVNGDLSNGFIQYEPSMILAKDFPELHRLQIFTEIGIHFLQRIRSPADSNDAKPAAHELVLGSGLFVLWPHSAATLELAWTNSRWNHRGTENEMYLTPGYLWRVRRNAEVGLGIPVGLNSFSDRFQITAHVVWEF